LTVLIFLYLHVTVVNIWQKYKELKERVIMKIKKIIFATVLSLCTMLSYSNEKIKMYALYTPSHEILKNEYFLPSIQDDFDIICEFCEQICPTAGFMNDGWTDTTIRKVDLIIRAIKENWGSIFIFSDVDIQFFAPVEKLILELMVGKDIVMQKNNPEGVLCTGFFACRGNEKTLQLWTDVKKRMQTDKLASDQISFNRCIKRHSKNNPYGVIWAYLPNSFFGGLDVSGFLERLSLFPMTLLYIMQIGQRELKIKLHSLSMYETLL